jgi:hypothetical protein
LFQTPWQLAVIPFCLLPFNMGYHPAPLDSIGSRFFRVLFMKSLFKRTNIKIFTDSIAIYYWVLLQFGSLQDLNHKAILQNHYQGNLESKSELVII